LRQEILEIPERAKECLEKNRDFKLPTGVPYLGMGSSFFAPLTLMYCGSDIQPQIASEYYYYLSAQTRPLGVLLSQSGESSETVWNLEKFEQIVAITDNPESSLGKSARTKQLVPLYSGPEQYSSTKSYVNTLIALYCGLSIDPTAAVTAVTDRFSSLDAKAKAAAQAIFEYSKAHTVKGLYVIGSGPNIGTAYQGALTLSETTKLSWIGMPVAQYDHGPKETANDTVVIILNSHGKDAKRIAALKETLSKSSALVVEVEEVELPEMLSPLTLITELNMIMDYLADLLQVGNTFALGGKVTTVSDAAK